MIIRVKFKGHKMKNKMRYRFLCEDWISSSMSIYYEKQYGHNIKYYIKYMKEKQVKRNKRKLQRAKERGEIYFTASPNCNAIFDSILVCYHMSIFSNLNNSGAGKLHYVALLH
jgi:hypothetical protein